MQQHARQNYLQAEVQTATPQKLQLLLIEAAIKNLHRTKAAWEAEKFDVGFETLSKAQDIVAEILSSLDRKNQPELAGKIAAIYVFIFRSMSEAGMTRNPQKLDDALRVLNSERETWRLVCEKFGSSVDSQTTHSAADSAVNFSSGNSSASLSSAKTVTTQSSTLSLSSQSSVMVETASKAAGKSGIGTATFNRPAGSYAAQVKPITPGTSGVNISGSTGGQVDSSRPNGNTPIKTATYGKPDGKSGSASGSGWNG